MQLLQGTASVVLAGLVASLKLVGGTLADHTYLFLGAGEVIFERKFPWQDPYLGILGRVTSQPFIFLKLQILKKGLHLCCFKIIIFYEIDGYDVTLPTIPKLDPCLGIFLNLRGFLPLQFDAFLPLLFQWFPPSSYKNLLHSNFIPYYLIHEKAPCLLYEDFKSSVKF